MLPLACAAALLAAQETGFQQTGVPDYDLPEVADSASASISPGEERKLGEQWLRQFRNNAPLYDDPLVFHYTEELCYRIAAAAPLSDRHINLVIIDDSTINAFAAPGNIIGINTGLLLQADAEGQVASVLAHELAHLTQRHYARRLNKGGGVSQTVLVLAALLAMVSGNSDVAAASLYATSAALVQGQLAHSRDAEREADRLGLHYLTESGYAPDSMIDMMDLLARLQGNRELPPQYLVTHPFAETRKTEIASAVHSLPRAGRNDSLAFRIAQIRLRAANSLTATRNLAPWKQEYRTTAKGNRRLVLAIGLATALSRLGNHGEALEYLDQVGAPPEAREALTYVKGEVLLAARRLEEAVNLLEQPYRRNTDSPLLAQMYSRALFRHGKLEEAARVAGRLRSERQDLPKIWQLSALIQAKMGNTVNYHRFEAGYLERVGRLREAAEHLTAAMRLSTDDLQLYEALREQRQYLLIAGAS